MSGVERYLAEAVSWDRDRWESARRNARRAWLMAGAGWLATLACALALLVLMPLKRVEPYLVRVDSSTGIVDVVPQLGAQAELPEAVTRYLLTRYVTTCERFNFPTAESDYEECGAFHAPALNQAWAARWTRTNPESPLNRYRDGTTLRAEVKSVAFIERSSGVQDLAQLRYVIEKRAGNGAAVERTHWIATVQYAWVAPSREPKVRRWNPLGFRIVAFRPEPEVLSEATVAAAGTAP